MKIRLDQHIMELGLAGSRNRAQELIKEGFVLLNGKICNKPAKEIITRRIRVPNLKKIELLTRSYVKYQLNLL